MSVSRRRLRALGAVLVVPLLLVMVGEAHAATLTRETGDNEGRLFWQDANDTADVIRLHREGGLYRLTSVNEGTTVSPGIGCGGGGFVPAGTTIACSLDTPAWRIETSPAADTVTTLFAGIPPDDPMTVVGFAGNDTIIGGEADDALSGGGGDDNLRGANGNDNLNGNNERDTLLGGAGDDLLDGGGAGDDFDGGDGTDTADFSEKQLSAVIDLDNVADDGTGGDGFQTDNVRSTIEAVIGTPFNDNLRGGLGNTVPIRLEGRDGNDSLTGSAGNDVLVGGLGADVMEGGSGTDYASYAGRDTGVTVTVKSGDDNDGGPDDGLPSNRDTVRTENVVGTDDDDVLIGDGGGNELRGEGGNDRIRGLLGNDVLRGGSGTDVLDYTDRGGDAPVTVSLDNVVNDGAAGFETDNIANEFEIVEGGAAGDSLSAAAMPGAELRGLGGSDTIFGPNGGGRVLGGDGDDRLTGGDGADLLEGELGNDTLDGLGGNDALRGAAGNDFIEARDGFVDIVDCGTEIDTAFNDGGDERLGCELPGPIVDPPVIVQPPPPPPPTVLDTRVGIAFAAGRRSTKILEVRVSRVPRGSRVTARCETKAGKRCKGKLRKRFTKRNTTNRIVRVKTWDNRSLRVGFKLIFRVTKPGTIGNLITVTIRKRKAPLARERCLPIGSSRPARCPD